MIFFFFSSRRRHTSWPRDWSSDVCSSDLAVFVNERPQRYICGIHKAQGCGKHGDPIQFIRDWENRTFREAVAILTGKDMPVVKPGSTKQTQAAAGGDWKR